MSRQFTAIAGLALLCLFLTFVAGPLGPIFAVCSALLAVAAAGLLVYSRRKGRYDLGALRELHESGGPPPEDNLPEVAADAGVVCPNCGTVYGAWMLICPNCKR